MWTHEGGSEVKGGAYFDLKHWEAANVRGKTGALPGGPERRFVRAPLLLIVAMAPVMGGLFVAFLPFIGVALFLGAIGRRIGQAVRLRRGTVPRAKRHGGDPAPRGVYFAPLRLRMFQARTDGEKLPGDTKVRWVRIPVALLFVVAPLVGGFYFVLLPVAGIALIFWNALRATGRLVSRAVAPEEHPKPTRV